MPQHLTSLDDTEVYFLVRDTYKDKKIVVKQGDRILLSKKALSLVPAEMEKIKIKKELISDGEIIISVE